MAGRGPKGGGYAVTYFLEKAVHDNADIVGEEIGAVGVVQGTLYSGHNAGYGELSKSGSPPDKSRAQHKSQDVLIAESWKF